MARSAVLIASNEEKALAALAARLQEEALNALTEYRYVAFFAALIAIGEMEGLNAGKEMTPQQFQAFKIFEAVWREDHRAITIDVVEEEDSADAKLADAKLPAKIIKKQTGYLTARYSRSQQEQDIVDKGLAQFTHSITNLNTLQEASKPKGESGESKDAKDSKVVAARDQATLHNELALNDYREKLRAKDKEAYKAIVGYKSYSQAALVFFGRFLAGVTAFAFGAIEAGTATAALLPSSWPLLAIYALTVLSGTLATWMNWKVFKDDVPAMLKDWVGKDEVFDGVDNYIDKNGNKLALNDIQKRQIRKFAVIAAFPTGIAIGALGYTSTLGIKTLPWIGPMLTSMGLSVLLPPIGITLAAFVAITMTLLFTRSIKKLLQEDKDLYKAVTKSFDAIDKQLGPNASIVTKGIVKAITLLLGSISLIGLAMACLTSTRSLGIFLVNQCSVSPAVATYISAVVCIIPGFVSRAWWSFKNMLLAPLALIRRISSDDVKQAQQPAGGPKASEKEQKPAVNVASVEKQPLLSSQEQKVEVKSAVMQSNEKAAQSTTGIIATLERWKKPVLAVAEAVQEGIFYGYSLTNTITVTDSAGNVLDTIPPAPTWLAGTAASTAGIRTFGNNLAYIDDPDKDPKEVAAKEQAAEARVGAMMGRMGG